MFQDSLKNRWISHEYITTKEMMKPSKVSKMQIVQNEWSNMTQTWID